MPLGDDDYNYDRPTDYDLERSQPILRYLKRIERAIEHQRPNDSSIVAALNQIAVNQVAIQEAETSNHLLNMGVTLVSWLILFLLVLAHVWHHW